MKPIIGITMGDAAGVGPEIIIKALSDTTIYDTCRPLVIGDASIMSRELTNLNSNLTLHCITTPNEALFTKDTIDLIDLNLLTANLAYGEVSAAAGNAAFRYLEKAIDLAKNNEISAICTAPLNKEALHKGGHLYPGHTEILADLTQTTDFSMMLATPDMKVIHLTTHMGLIEAIQSITPERTYSVIKLGYNTLLKSGLASPKIAVCGINPHAGENGLFGNDEEGKQLLPGIERAQAEGIDVIGPLPADTLFYRAGRGDFDLVVACYHDQGHTPVKVLGIESGVNITVGLNYGVIRTSVDHGTAFDIAGKNKANDESMIAAIQSAIELSPIV